MRIKKFLTVGLSALIAATMAVGLVACDNTSDPTDSTSGTNSSGTTSSDTTSAGTIIVWCPTEVMTLMQTQLDNFTAAYADQGFNYTFSLVESSETNAASNMISDPSSGGDLYFFAQDQLARLVQAGALATVSSSFTEDVTSRNDSGSVAAATLNSTLYAYPLTSDNGYFMYYDTSVLSEEDIEDQTALIAACKTAGKTINFNLGTDGGWYTMGYFFATGCESTWSTDDDGTFQEPVDTVNSSAGYIAVEGMAELVNSGVWVDSHDASQLGSTKTTTNEDGTTSTVGGAAVVVSGTWDYSAAYQALGENLGCTDLWSFTVDGTDYHLGSFLGNKLLGVRPQTDATKSAWCQVLANYLSGETCQQERFEAYSWGPSNLNAQASESVQASPALAAIAAQSNYATPQGQYPDDWWSAIAGVGEAVAALGTTTPTNDQIKTVLDEYTTTIGEITAVTTQLGIVGSFNSWNNADETYLIGYDNNTYTSKTEASPLYGTWTFTITFAEGDMFRVTKFNSWDTYVGYSNLTSDSASDLTGNDDDNIIIAAAGTYTIVIDSTGSSWTIKVTLAS